MEHQAENRWVHDGITVIDCGKCGFRHQDPIPSADEIREVYRHEFAGSVREGFRERKRRDEEYWAHSFERRRLTYEELVGRGRILDVGCGDAGMLHFFKQNGWQVFGIEPSEHFTQDHEERGIPVALKLVHEIEDWESIGEFDVINMTQVLEHVREPATLLGTLIEKALRPSGILTVEVPNDFNDFQLAAREVHDLPRWWIHPLHINYFGFDTLEDLLRTQGLELEVREGQFPLEFFLLFGDQYVGDSELGRTIHLKRAALEANLANVGRVDLVRDLYRSLAELGIGRTAIVHARLPEVA